MKKILFLIVFSIFFSVFNYESRASDVPKIDTVGCGRYGQDFEDTAQISILNSKDQENWRNAGIDYVIGKIVGNSGKTYTGYPKAVGSDYRPITFDWNYLPDDSYQCYIATIKDGIQGPWLLAGVTKVGGIPTSVTKVGETAQDAKKLTITCKKGIESRQVIGESPACPTGFTNALDIHLTFKAYSKCKLYKKDSSIAGVALLDNGATLTFSSAGKYSSVSASAASYSDVACSLLVMNAPSFVTAQIDTTRALDGLQKATWGKLRAFWTYHPDNGLNISFNSVEEFSQTELDEEVSKAAAAATKKTTITCVKGKITKKVTAVKPKCPAGYKKKA